MFERKDIAVGLFMTKDGGPCIEAPKPPPPRLVRYGAFAAVSASLDQVKVRLEKLRADLRAERQRRK